MTVNKEHPFGIPEEHCMIDLETFGVSKNSCILQIAAVKFYQDLTDLSLKPLSVQNILVDPESCKDLGLSFDLNTVMWWMTKPGDEARKMVMTQKGRIPLPQALQVLSTWIGPDTRVWGNGASFDLAILDSAYEACKITKPWKHYNERCYRTLNALRPQDSPERPAREGVHHDGLGDCYHQIKQLDWVLRSLLLRIN